MPKRCNDPDDKEYFTYTTMLRILAAGDEPAISRAFIDFERTCEGKFRFDFMITMIGALIRGEATKFNDALKDYLDSVQELSPQELEELDPGNDDLDIAALALVQVARCRNVPLTLAHRMLPPELLMPCGRMPTDGYPSWP